MRRRPAWMSVPPTARPRPAVQRATGFPRTAVHVALQAPTVGPGGWDDFDEEQVARHSGGRGQGAPGLPAVRDRGLPHFGTRHRQRAALHGAAPARRASTRGPRHRRQHPARDRGRDHCLPDAGAGRSAARTPLHRRPQRRVHAGGVPGPATGRGAPMRSAESLPSVASAETQGLRERVRELDEALRAIRAGQVDAFIIPGGVATSDTARSAADRLRQGTLEQMWDAVLAFDHVGHVVYMNPAAERQYGWASADALGRPRAAIYEEQPEVAGSDATAPSCVAWIHRLRDGRSIHVESTVSPLLDGEAQVFGTVAVVRDVTERRRAEDRRDALAKLGERLREAEDARQAGLAAEHALAAGLGASRAACLWFDSEAAAETCCEAHGAVPGPLAALKGAAYLALPQAGEPKPAQASCATGASGALLSASIHVAGGSTAVLAAWNWETAHCWAPAEVEFARDVADRTRAAFERIEAAAALRDSEAR